MIKVDREHVKRIFADYVRHYNDKDPKIRLKIVHTYKVSELCDDITASLGLSAEDRELAWLMGMLHDLGRFEQLRQYHTFQDAESVSHAALGCRILFEEGMLSKFVDMTGQETEAQLLHKAIACHSDYRIPEEYDERTKLFCNLLRDADKIDILRANCETPLEDIYNVSTEELLQAEVSEAVMEQFKRCTALPRKIRKTPADYVVGMISMMFELVYPKSWELVRRQGYLEKLLCFPSQNEKTRQQFLELRKILEQFAETSKIQ